MIVRQSTTVDLKPDEEKTLSIDAACINMKLRQPSGSDTFLVQENASGDLSKLLALPGFGHEDGRVQQFAIWTITENPSMADYVDIIATYTSQTGQQTTRSGPPTDLEMQRIRQLLQNAGIDLSKYQVFNSAAGPLPNPTVVPVSTSVQPHPTRPPPPSLRRTQAPRAPLSPGQPAGSTVSWPFHRMGARWPPVRMTQRCACGGYPMALYCVPCRGIPVPFTAWPFPRMGAASLRFIRSDGTALETVRWLVAA